MKKAVLFLSALLMLTALVFAGEKAKDEKAKAGCSEKCMAQKGKDGCCVKDSTSKAAASCAEKCKMAKGSAGCAMMKADEKATSGETKPAECPMHAQAAKAEGAVKIEEKATSGEAKPAECPMHAQAAKAEGAVKTEEIAAPAKPEMVKAEGEANAPAPTCGDKVQSMELKQFHAAMHPMALAIGFEGEEKPDLAKVRELYPAMKEKTDALANMPVDEKTAKDTKAFTEKRAELVKLVDELGVACKGTDDSKIKPAFENVHEGYIQLVTLTK